VLGQLFGAERLDRDRHLLDAFGAVRGGHHDLAQSTCGPPPLWGSAGVAAVAAEGACSGEGAASGAASAAKAAIGTAMLERTVEAPRMLSMRLIGARCSNTIVHAP
jgi:hypothetical protein